MTTDNDIWRLAENAISFLRSEAAQEALDRMEAECVKHWENGTAVEAREAAHAKLVVVKDFRRHLRAMADQKPLMEARMQREGVARVEPTVEAPPRRQRRSF